MPSETQDDDDENLIIIGYNEHLSNKEVINLK